MPGRLLEWDPVKEARNVAKHGLNFTFAMAVLADAKAIDFDVSRSEDREERRKMIGQVGSHLFVVVYTPRDIALRVISLRRANSSEIRRYGDR